MRVPGNVAFIHPAGKQRGKLPLHTPSLLLLSFSEVLGFASSCDVCFGERGRKVRVEELGLFKKEIGANCC